MKRLTAWIAAIGVLLWGVTPSFAGEMGFGFTFAFGPAPHGKARYTASLWMGDVLGNHVDGPIRLYADPFTGRPYREIPLAGSDGGLLSALSDEKTNAGTKLAIGAVALLALAAGVAVAAGNDSDSGSADTEEGQSPPADGEDGQPPAEDPEGGSSGDSGQDGAPAGDAGSPGSETPELPIL